MSRWLSVLIVACGCAKSAPARSEAPAPPQSCMPAQCRYYRGPNRVWGPLAGQLCVGRAPRSFSIMLPDNPEGFRPDDLKSGELVNVMGSIASSNVNEAGRWDTLATAKHDVTGCISWGKEHAMLCARAVNP